MAKRTWEGLALAYQDGSFTVLMEVDGGTMSIEDARLERAEADRNETDPDMLTNIVRVRLEELEVVERYRGEPIPEGQTARQKLLAEVSAEELEAALKAKRASSKKAA